jgi:hypothetical protein
MPRVRLDVNHVVGYTGQACCARMRVLGVPTGSRPLAENCGFCFALAKTRLSYEQQEGIANAVAMPEHARSQSLSSSRKVRAHVRCVYWSYPICARVVALRPIRLTPHLPESAHAYLRYLVSPSNPPVRLE